MRVLVVEDDDGVAAALCAGLDAARHVPSRAGRGEQALLEHHEADVVLLDMGLPDLDGMDVLARLRRVSTVPVIVLTARGDERSVVRGLRTGADDWIVKPVRLGELLARIEVVARRRPGPRPARARVVTAGDLAVDLAARTVTVAGAHVAVTRTEFDVLAVLCARAGESVSREMVLDAVWGDAFAASSRSLDVHLAQLRAKLGRPGSITTVRGYGYRFEAPAREATDGAP